MLTRNRGAKDVTRDFISWESDSCGVRLARVYATEIEDERSGIQSRGSAVPPEVPSFRGPACPRHLTVLHFSLSARGMGWKCPACAAPIEHRRADDLAPGKIYRCPVCRLNLIFDPTAQTMKAVLAKVAFPARERRRRSRD